MPDLHPTLSPIRAAQGLLLAAAAALWAASRMTWVTVTSFDELGPPKPSTLDGATWATALLPMAVLLVAAALAALAVRGWLLRVVALLVAVVCFAIGYLGLTLIVMPDVGPRGAELAGVPVATLVASGRQVPGAVVTLIAAVAALAAAVLLMRAAVSASRPARYAVSGATSGTGPGPLSERGLWDALDQGRDPTREPDPETEGR